MIHLPIYATKEHYTVNPTKIIALGLNYKSHIEESQSVKVKGFTNEIPHEPILFAKTPNVLIGPEQPIVIPQFLKNYPFRTPRVDYEAELALIIKDKCKAVPENEALDHILGFTCMNDVSQRNLQNSERAGWFRGKSFDTFGPIGPQIVRPQDIGNVQNLSIRCRLNGKTVQDSDTKHMIFSITEIIAFVSLNFTLMPGDIITTGTPSGVGPIQTGDTVEVEIEKIGVLRNPVVEERVSE
ncbi:fumarylacetoacetate hydrolase family protein [Desulfococcaceae bacterium HSG7]|nr:fumarylacetoacetate hydrolase family protein [Desulfococcaceae bacterium HSG7]